jgi:outer membrane protein assembly factor BamB
MPTWAAGIVLGVGVLVLAQALAGVARGAPEVHRPGPVATAAPINTTFPGLTTFRGNASRSYYGEGPVPSDPVERWVYPAGGAKMCAMSAETQTGPKKLWCGTGWTGQPNVVPWKRGMQVRVGAFDDRYHFLDAGTGTQQLPDLQTGDLAKGSATTDADGFPLYYAGSRDDQLRVIAMDRSKPTVLWQVDAHTSVPQPLWNDDWDGAPLQIGDYLLEGGENSWFYVIRLHRGYGADGLVRVDPKIVATVRGWDSTLLGDIHDPPPQPDVSIENSVAFRDGIVYFANSGGLVQGWDIADLLNGGATPPKRVFRFWTGDDTDASVVIDEDGFLYVASEYQRFNARSQTIGQLMKLDPRRDDPLVWSIHAPEIGFEGAGGSWSTPAIYGDYVYFTTAAGRVLEVERSSGRIVWELQIGAPSIASPVVVDGTLLQGDCSGHLYAWDVSDPTAPPPLRWKLDLGDCIESTPAVWHGWLYVGTREGFLYGLADAGTPPPSP